MEGWGVTRSCGSIPARSVRLLADGTFVLVQRRHFANLPAQNMLAEVVSQRLDLVRRVCVRRHAEHCFRMCTLLAKCSLRGGGEGERTLVELFERESLGFGHEEECKEESDDTEEHV